MSFTTLIVVEQQYEWQDAENLLKKNSRSKLKSCMDYKKKKVTFYYFYSLNQNDCSPDCLVFIFLACQPPTFMSYKCLIFINLSISM